MIIDAESRIVDSSIDLRALLVEREDCDAGTVSKLREGLSEGGEQLKNLRHAAEGLKRKLDKATPEQGKKLYLKLGIAHYFLGLMRLAVEYLEKSDGALANFYLGKALSNRGDYGGALEAFQKSEKAGYSKPQVQLQAAGVHRLMGEIAKAKTALEKLTELSSHSAEYHFQVAGVRDGEGDSEGAVVALEKAVELDPGHTGALFRLGFENDLAGNDEKAIDYYEQCLKYPPVNKGVLNNLGVLYEDSEKYDKAVECYDRLLKADPLDERARLFYKDADASRSMYYSPEDEMTTQAFRQVLEIPVTDFELSVRARNCLKKMNIKTLGDLTRVTEAQLMASKNFGETSLDEVQAIMQSKGLSVGQSIEQGVAHEARLRPQPALSAEEQAILNKSVAELNLSVRARKCMSKLGVTTLSDLVSRSADDLLEAKNFGVTSLIEVREKLQQYGLKLRGD